MSDEAIAGDTGDGGFGVEHAASEVASRRAKPAADIEVAYDKRNAPETVTPREAGEDLERYRFGKGDPADIAASRPIEELKYPDDNPNTRRGRRARPRRTWLITGRNLPLSWTARRWLRSRRPWPSSRNRSRLSSNSRKRRLTCWRKRRS